jgi:hypothetical protein
MLIHRGKVAEKSREGKRTGVSAAGFESARLDFFETGVIIHQFAWEVATPTFFSAFDDYL